MLIYPIIIFILILSVLVFIHELGHFLAALKFKIKVDEFGIGIPPRAFAKKVGDVVYSINWLPIGGFVRIKGEDFDDFDPKDKSNFINKKPWQKSVVLLAGIFMNLVFAVILFYIVLGMNQFRSNPLILIGDYSFKFGDVQRLPNVVLFIEDNSPAQKSKITFGDRIVRLSYENSMSEPATVEELREFLKDKEQKPVNIDVENINTGVKNSYVIAPTYSETTKRPALGVNLGDSIVINYQKPHQKLFAGFTHSVNVIGYSTHVLGLMISESFRSKDISPVAQGVAGPVGIFGAVKSVVEFGGDKVIVTILDLMAIFSLSLAVMNLLPIPALDGGRFVFVALEWISGKRPSQRLEAGAHKIGYVFLLGLIILITVKDVWQLVG